MKEPTESREELIAIARQNVSPDIFWEAIGPDAITGPAHSQAFLEVFNVDAAVGIKYINSGDAEALGLLLLERADKYIQQAAEDVVEGWPR